MALKQTQNQLKREFKEKLQKLQYAIYGQCYDCMGFHADGYHDCEMKDCPLYTYRLRANRARWSKSLASYLGSVKRQIQQKEVV